MEGGEAGDLIIGERQDPRRLVPSLDIHPTDSERGGGPSQACVSLIYLHDMYLQIALTRTELLCFFSETCGALYWFVNIVTSFTKGSRD